MAIQTHKTIRWGIIGAGDVAEVKSGPGFQKAPNSELRAVMRRNASKAEDFARRHHVPHWYSDVDTLLADRDIDAAYIATPPANHKDQAMAALAAGKDVYVEKPVALNAAEVDEIMAAEAQYGKKVCAAHYRRYLPGFVKLRELLDAGAIGKPLLARLDMLQPLDSGLIAESDENWRLDSAISGGGLFHDLAPHQLDLMLHWFGDADIATGIGQNQCQHYDADDCVLGWARLGNGVVLEGRWHFAVAPDQNRDLCEIIGTEGSLTINFFGDSRLTLNNDVGEQVYEIANPPHVQQPMIEQVNAYFRGERSNPCPLSEARQVMSLMESFTGKV